jgi:hypothetical protein
VALVVLVGLLVLVVVALVALRAAMERQTLVVAQVTVIKIQRHIMAVRV